MDCLLTFNDGLFACVVSWGARLLGFCCGASKLFCGFDWGIWGCKTGGIICGASKLFCGFCCGIWGAKLLGFCCGIWVGFCCGASKLLGFCKGGLIGCCGFDFCANCFLLIIKLMLWIIWFLLITQFISLTLITGYFLINKKFFKSLSTT